METCRVTPSPNLRAATAAGLACLAALAGCSSVEGILAGDKIDYRSTSTRTTGLDVPPDLTQLAKDTRYQPSSGVVSASTFQAAPATPATAAGPAAGHRRGSGRSDAGGGSRRDDGDADGRADRGRQLQDRAARQRPLAQHDPDPGAGLSAGAHLLEGQRLQPRPGPPGSRRDRDRVGREPRQAAERLHPPLDRPGLRERLSRPASSTSSAPGSSARRPAATSTSAIAAWKRSTSASARSRRSGSRAPPIPRSRPSSWRA